jgi:hypothetical protein
MGAPLLTVAQTMIFQMDSSNCFMVCKIPLQYKIDTIRVIDVPEKKKHLRVPEIFQVSYDTVIDWSNSIQKKYPPVYQIIEKKDGSMELKPVNTGNDVYFFLRQSIAVNENKLKLKDAAYEELTLPVRYTYIETSFLLPNQQTEKTVPVLCPDKITKGIILQIKNGLFLRGYKLNNLQPDVVDAEFFDVLAKYQEEHYLPIGGLNFPTLESLDIIP